MVGVNVGCLVGFLEGIFTGETVGEKVGVSCIVNGLSFNHENISITNTN
jgi:hypothetical protein